MNATNGAKWSRGELAAVIAQGIGQFAIGIARVAAPYKAIELGASAFGVGLVGGAFAALAFAIAVPTGIFADRVGEKWILVGGSGLIMVSPLVQSSSTGLLILMLGQALLGLGQTTLAIGTQTRIARSIGTLSGDERFARMSISAAVANMAAPVIAGALVASSGLPLLRSGLSTAYWVAAACGLLGLVVILPIAGTGDGRPVLVPPRRRGSIRELLRDPGLRQALLISLGVLTTIDVLITYLPLLGEERGIGPAFIGLLLSLRSGSALVSRLALPWMLRRTRREMVLRWMTGLAGFSLCLLAFPMPQSILAVLVFAVGFGIGVGQPLTMSWTAERAGSLAGSALAIRMTSNRSGQLLVPTVLGALGAAIGTGSIFVVVAVGLGASAWHVGTYGRRGPIDDSQVGM